jgi:hypothetical protein
MFAILAFVGTAPVAHASYLGANGKISYDVYTGNEPTIWTIDPDGTDAAPLIPGGATSAWSSDGRRVAYSCNGGENTCTAAADGSDVDVIPNTGVFPQQRPFWSPDSKTLIIDNLVIDQNGDISGDVWRIDAADGGDRIVMAQGGYSGSWSQNGRIAFTDFDERLLTDYRTYIATVHAMAPNVKNTLTASEADEAPDWSPDGTKIVFHSLRDDTYEIYVMDADGSNETRLTTTTAHERRPVWSPDGTKIVFERSGDLWMMNPDGTGQTAVTNTPGVTEQDPAWQPLPLPGYARPKGAAYLRVPLVPAFLPCQTPDHTHGAPLAEPSCAPPQTPFVAYMTFGAAPPGASPKAAGHVRFDVTPGVPGGENDADVRIAASLTDVRRASDLSDGTGGLEVQMPLRLTDRYSGAFNREPATMQDNKLLLVLPCTETADPAIGSTCSATTSANALIPTSNRLIQEGKRSVWELGQIEVFDGGDDGSITSRDDNTRLAVQGIFVP